MDQTVPILKNVARTWVLRTETKGTGAEMVPLERTEKRSTAVEPVFVPKKPARSDHPEAPTAQEPRKFKVVDVMTRQSLVEGAGAQETVEALKAVRSAVDIDVYVWQSERGRCRRLMFAEKRAMLDLARG